MKKKILALVMSCALFASMLPSTVLASIAETDDAQTEDAVITTDETEDVVTSDKLSFDEGSAYEIEIGTDADAEILIDDTAAAEITDVDVFEGNAEFEGDDEQAGEIESDDAQNEDIEFYGEEDADTNEDAEDADEADDAEDAEADDEEAEEEDAEDVLYKVETGGVIVEVTAPANALPEGAELYVERYSVDSEEYKEAAEAIDYEIKDDNNNMAALDISFYLDGEEIEPTEPVKVSIDVSQILPDDVDASTIEVQHLVEIEDGEDVIIDPVLVADDSDYTEGTIDEETAVAEFEVDSFSTFTVTWEWTEQSGTTSSVSITVTAYLDGQELDGLDNIEFDSQDDELNLETMLNEEHFGTSDYTFSWAYVEYSRTQGPTTTTTTIGSQDDPVEAIEKTSGGQSSFIVVQSSGTTTTVQSSYNLHLYAYYVTPTFSVEITPVAEDDAEDWLLQATLSHAGDYESVSYAWSVTDTDGNATTLASVDWDDETGRAFIVWGENVQNFDEVVVHVTATITRADGSTASASASYTLEYGDENVNLQMTYGPNNTALGSGVTVTLTNTVTGETYEGTTDANGQILGLEIVPGIYLVEASTTINGSNYSCSETVSMSDAGTYTINLNYADADKTSGALDSSKTDWNHVDIKLSTGTTGSDVSSEGVTVNITGAVITDSSGNIKYTADSTSIQAGASDNEWQIYFYTGTDTSGSYSHSISFATTDTITIIYTLQWADSDEPETYTVTIDSSSTYDSGTTYPANGQRAYKLYNYLYGTDYSSNAQLMAAGVDSIDIGGMSMMLVAAILCDSSTVNGAGDVSGTAGMWGMDFALSVEGFVSLSTAWTFDVEKTYENHAMTAGMFTFNLYDASVSGNVWTTSTWEYTWSNSAAGKNIDGNSTDTMSGIYIPYNDDEIQAGTTYYYILYEDSGTADYTYYDGTVYGAKVYVHVDEDATSQTYGEAVVEVTYYTLTSNGNNTFTATEYSGEKITLGDNNYPTFHFTNTYTTDVVISKTDTNGNALTDAAFTLTQVVIDPDTGETRTCYYDPSDENGPWIDYTSESDIKSFTMGTIHIATPYDGTYTLTEVTAPNGYTVLPDAITFTVTDGIINEGSVAWADSDTTENITDYVTLANAGLSLTIADETATGGVQLGVTKTITGRASTAKTFTFALYEADSSFNYTAEGLLKNQSTTGTLNQDEAQSVVFDDEITFSSAGDHYYVILENTESGNGWTCDSTEYHVTVSTEYQNGSIVVTSVSYIHVDSGGQELDRGTLTADGNGVYGISDGSTLSFTNTYGISGQLALSGTKTFTNGTIGENQFSFTLTEQGGEYTETVYAGTDGNFTFTAIEYDYSDIGQHTYIIQEVIPEGATAENNYTLNGVAYDPTIYTVVATVSETDEGSLVVTYTVTVVDEAVNNIEFTNYQLGSLNVSKHVVEKDTSSGLPLEVPYRVTVTASANEVDFQFVTIMVDGEDVTSTSEIDSEAGTITFEIKNGQTVNISGLPLGSYTVEEYVDANDSFEPVYRVGEEETETAPTVDVTALSDDDDDDDDSTVMVEIDNEYTVSTSVQVQKSYDGSEYPDEGFTFTIEALSCDLDAEGVTLTDMPMPENPSVTVNDSDAVSFGDITFAHFGTYYYKITETKGSLGYIDYDSSVYYVKIVVGFNEDSGEEYYEETVVESYAKANGEVEGEGYKDLDYTTVDDIVTAVFTNTYSASGSVTFGGEKKITGKDEETTQTFTFELYTTDSDFSVAEEATATDTQTVTGAGFFTFKTISYDSGEEGNGAGTYYYVVKETATNENGWTSDTKEYHITVVVTDAGNGTFTLEVTCVDAEGQSVVLTGTNANGVYNFTGLDFTNEYEPAPTSVQFTGTKYITNSASDSDSTDKVFTFELYNADSSFAAYGDAIDTKTTTGAGTITFDEIEYKETGTYYYVIQEKALDEAEGWTIDPTVYNITVEVTDDGLGQLVATVTESTKGTVTGTDNVYGGFDFTNAYAAEGAVTLGVVKSISGVASTDKTFSFTLYNSDESFVTGDSVGDLVDTITTDGMITNSTQLNFTAISYKKAGTYYYIIKETGTALDGWTLDTKEYHVTVTVKDNGDGTLTTSASYAYTDEDGNTQTENSAAFTNTYAATGELALTGTKTFTGGDLTADGFTFTMADSTGASVGDVTMDASGNITFPTLTYDETDIGGEYTYTITETNANASSVVYDDTTYTVVVSVADNGNGTLDVTYTVNGTASGDITFTNYQKGSLTISKSFTGLDEDQIASLDGFTITVKSSNGDTVATLTLDDADEGSTYTWTVSDLVAGTYTVTETGYSLDGYEVIAKSGEVTVTDGSDVSVNDALSWGGEDTVAFTNDYTEVGSLSISKHVVEDENSNVHHLDVGYTVVITAAGDDAVDFQWVTITDSNGAAIGFTADTETKTITFTIKNSQILTVNGLPAGKYTVEETVADDSDLFEPVYRVDDEETEGEPTVTVAAGDENVVSVEIENEYPIGTYIQVKKNYNSSVYPQDSNAFTFTIEPLSCDLEPSDVTLTADEMPMPTYSTVTITDSNAVSFGLMEFEHLGTYYYKITETNGGLSYIDYDSSVYYVKIVVEYLENENETYYVETAEESYCKQDEETEDYKDLTYTPVDTIVTVEFTNTYSAKGGVTLTATKDYTGAKLTEGQFDFTITETTADATYTGTGTNDAAGNITFTPAIEYTFDDVGTHTYVITETAGDAGGVTYASNTITVTVVVSDNNDGTLSTIVTVDGEGIIAGDDGSFNVGTFENSYQATGSVTFGGEKKITGKDEETTQTFTFELYTTDSDFTVAEDATATDTQTVTGAGSFTFKTISYDSDTDNGAGTYYYVVKETSTDENGWTMDTTEYHITVVVTDAGDGTFTMAATCVDADGETVTLTQADDGSYTGLDFTNNYEPAPTSVQFTGSKYITNNASDENKDKEFKFELYSADSSFTTDGDAIDTQTITGAGTITFDKITYDKTGTYYYVINEVQEEAAGWTMSETVYNIAVEVTDDGLGQLVATVTVNGTEAAGTDDVYGGFDFTNAYAAEGSVTLGVVKSISGVASTEEEFEFTLYNSDESFATGNSIETVKTDGTITNSTQLNFTAIPYTKAGTYYYIIKETGTAYDGWTLDEKEYQVTVTVTDNGDGTLTTSASYVYTDEEGETQSENSAAFTNTYAATGELALTGTKTFTGGDLTADGFTFTMADSTGASVGNVTMDASGNITFPTLTYDETDIGGEYTYTITEVAGTDSSVQYDETTYTVVVSVADNKDGTLEVTYTVNGTASGDITFTNYQKGSLTISKSFTGLDEDQIASLDGFTITVKSSNGDTVATLTLDDADDDSAYTWTVSDLPAGTYTVTETGYSLDGYEVIAKSGEVTVTDGADVSVNDALAWGGKDTVEFTNDYTEVGTITVSKYVTAEEGIQKDHEGTEYTVVITASENVDFQWVTVTSDSGREITPTIDGRTITFTITEDETITISGLPAGEYTVEEQGSNAMTSEHCVPNYRIGDEDFEEAPTVTVASGEENIVAVEIDNEYPIGTYIMVKKNYNKDEFPEEGFTFTIEALSCDLDAEDVTLTADEMPMPQSTTLTMTGSNVGYIGLITFGGDNEFEHFGTYYYKITETMGSEENIDYDTSVHYIKVVVGYDQDTHIETTDEWEAKADAETTDYKNLEYTEAGGGIVTAEFTNTAYEELSIEKEVSGNAGDTSEYEFEITLTNSDGTPFEGTLTMSSSSDVSPNKFVAFLTGLVKAYASDGTLTFEGGKATVTVTAGETVTIMVPSGVTCTVTEVGSNADSVNVSVNGVYQAQSSTTEATADAGTITDSTQVKFVNSYRRYFPIDEEIVTDEDDIFDKDAWVKDEAVNEYNAIEIEMTTTLPVVTAYDLSNGDFTLNFHEVLDHELVLDEDTADFSVYIGEQAISTAYYRITFDDDTGDDCNFHVDVDLTALYNDGIITEDDLQGDTEITVFFFADLEGTGLNGSYKSTVWYDVMDGDEILYTSDESVVEVYTYEIEIFKYDEETDDALAGATLGVYYDKDCTNPVSRNGEAYTETSGEDGYAIFYGLADGTYYVKETEAPTGYVLSEEVLEVVLGEDLNDSGYAYEGSYANTPSTVSVPVEKVWDDSDDAAGIRPTSVEVVLYKNGESTGRVLILNEDNDWSGSFDNLDEYNEGVKNEYTVEEHEVENYTTEITGDAEAGYVVTNTYSEEPEPEPEPTPPPTPEDAMQVTVIKVWEGDDESVRPDSIDITLLKSGEVCDTVTLNEANDWRYTWSDLEMGSYAVKEETVPNPYEVSYLDKWLEVGENAYQMIVTNTYHEEWLPEPGPGPASGNPDTGTPDKTNPSRTADADLPILPIAGCFAAIAMIAGVLVYRRKRSI